MRHTRTWTDVYGSARASFEGRPGGHTWLVASPPELARAVPAALEALNAKGSVELVVHDGLTPLLGAAQEVQPRGVLVVAPLALAGGPAVRVPDRQVETEGGGSYSEGGEFPGWTGWAPGGRQPDRSENAECAAASAAALLDLPVLVTTPAGLGTAFEAWLDATPHGR